MFKVFSLVSLVFICACSGNNKDKSTTETIPNADLTHLNFTVEDAPEWTNLFKRTSGWFGGDGIFCIPRNEGDKLSDSSETLIIFSDTMIGEIEGDSLKPGYEMLHNSVATLKGDLPKKENIQFDWAKNTKGGNESLFIPNTPNSKPGDYYWLGDGFVNHELNDNTYIFGYRIIDLEGVVRFGFEHVGSTLIILPKGSKPPYKDQRQIDIPLFKHGENVTESMAFGSGIYVNTKQAGAVNADGYVYVYGVRGKVKSLVAARVLPADFETFSKWTFWDGNNWVAEMDKVADITNHISNELSVSRLDDGRYALVFQVDGITSTIGLRLGSSPVGPFGPIIKIFDCKDALVGKELFGYNAKAHPALSKSGELLISYNVNSFDFKNDIKIFPNLYRPRFIRVKMQ